MSQLIVVSTIYSSYILDVGEASGGKKAVDWAALFENQDDMIDPKYLPADFVFRDPSKMKKAHFQALLEHWYGRQEDAGTKTVFAFKGYWDASRNLVMAVDNKHPAHQKRLKQPARKLRPKRTTSKSAREANAARKRQGPPGIRKGDEQWPIDFDSEGDEVEGGDEDRDMDVDRNEDEDDNGEEEEEEEPLPFSAPRVVPRGASVAAKKKTRLPAVARKLVPKVKARLNADASSSKSTNRDQASKTDKLESGVTKRPLPRPAYRGIPSDAAASQPSPTAPKPVKEKPSGRPAPLFEGPTTRSGGKRKVDDAELQTIGEPSKKKGKNNAVTKGSSKRKILSKRK